MIHDVTDLYRASRHRLSRLWRLAVIAGIGLALVFLLDRSGMVETLDWATYDLSFRLRGERAA